MRVRRLYKNRKTPYGKYKNRLYLNKIYEFASTKHEFIEKGRSIYYKRRDIDEKTNDFWDWR